MKGHLVIADISGYTRFLTESELEHANGIVTELLNAVIAAIKAPLQVSRIEGDAVFMYGVKPEGMTGQTILESVELLYCSFAAALETMVLNTTCTCNACANITSLGLKIVMHCGEFAISEIGGTETLTGPDVIIAHRLLKNNVTSTTGIGDYMLVTQNCVDDLEIQPMVSAWVEHTEEYEGVGRVTGYVSSLPDVWAFVRQQNEVKVVQKDAWLTITANSAASPAVVWDHLVDPIKRTQWLDAVENVLEGTLNGRIGVGTDYHCAHGDDTVTIMTVLDIRPLEYITFLAQLESGVALRYTDYIIPSGEGTRIVAYAEQAFDTASGDRLPQHVLDEMADMIAVGYEEQLNRMAEMAASALVAS